MVVIAKKLFGTKKMNWPYMAQNFPVRENGREKMCKTEHWHLFRRICFRKQL
jgi:hypothetical protein